MFQFSEGIAWQPSASMELIRYRASILNKIRRFFEKRNVLEVETPALAHATVTDPNIDSFTTQYEGPGQLDSLNLYLQTSPEFAMKRLLAAGSGAIYQICKVFRQAEWGRFHNPEFTMVEWYRPDFDYHELMAEVSELVFSLVDGQNLFEKTLYYTYSEVFQNYLQVDPISCNSQQLSQIAKSNNITVEGLANDDTDAWLDLIFSHLIQPQLLRNRLVFISEYPMSQAALAQASCNDNRYAQRFELFLNGVELANGYNELTDASILLDRIEIDKQKREQHKRPSFPVDYRLLAAMEAGLPICSGVAMGLDRLIMILCQENSIENVIAFPISRA